MNFYSAARTKERLYHAVVPAAQRFFLAWLGELLAVGWAGVGLNRKRGVTSRFDVEYFPAYSANPS